MPCLIPLSVESAADHIKLGGKHNVENVVTALTLVTAPGT
jgi:UDP-N-acetylmuramyl tripeptide synthase